MIGGVQVDDVTVFEVEKILRELGIEGKAWRAGRRGGKRIRIDMDERRLTSELRDEFRRRFVKLYMEDNDWFINDTSRCPHCGRRY